MARTSTNAGPTLTEADFVATREGRWYIVQFRGKAIARRYTRDEAFTSVWILFKNHQSPALPQIEANFETEWNGYRHVPRVEWRGSWSYRRRYGYGPNRIEIPISRDKPPRQPRDMDEALASHRHEENA